MKKCLNSKILVFLLLLLPSFGCKTYVPKLNSNLLVKAQNGDAEAQFEMGKIYFELGWKQPIITKSGTVTENWDEAEQWFVKSANQGHVKAKYYLYQQFRRKSNYECNIDCLKQVALEGISDAQYSLGGTYLDYEHGTSKDLSLAYKWISLALKSKLTNGYDTRVLSLKDLIEIFKISHLEISKGQIMAKEHTEKYSLSKSMYPEK